MAHDPLRVTLDDLRSTESRGKWWLVGAAWAGDPLLEHRANTTGGDHQVKNPTTIDEEDIVVQEDALLKLARKQGMNTDIRRKIFVVLMSSDVSIRPLKFQLAPHATFTARIIWMPVSD